MPAGLQSAPGGARSRADERRGWIHTEALLDTGFDGEVIVPPELILDGHHPAAYLTWTLVDGSEVAAPALTGSVRIGGMEPIKVVVTALGDEPMIGREITRQFRIILDHGERVIVEP